MGGLTCVTAAPVMSNGPRSSTVKVPSQVVVTVTRRSSDVR